MTMRAIPALLNVLTAIMPAALVVPAQWSGVSVGGVFLLALLREQLPAHRARVAENLLRLERAEAERSKLARQLESRRPPPGALANEATRALVR
jgi:hypothetical protein